MKFKTGDRVRSGDRVGVVKSLNRKTYNVYFDNSGWCGEVVYGSELEFEVAVKEEEDAHVDHF